MQFVKESIEKSKKGEKVLEAEIGKYFHGNKVLTLQ